MDKYIATISSNKARAPVLQQWIGGCVVLFLTALVLTVDFIEYNPDAFIESSRHWQTRLEKERGEKERIFVLLDEHAKRKEIEKHKLEKDAELFEEIANAAYALTIPSTPDYNGMDGLPPPDVFENIEKARKYRQMAEDARKKAKACEPELEELRHRHEKLKYQLNELSREAGMWQKMERDLRNYGSNEFVKRVSIKAFLIMVLLACAAIIIRN